MDDLSLRCDCSDLYIFTARSPMLSLALCSRGVVCKTHLMKTGSTARSINSTTLYEKLPDFERC
eukprot:10762748-Heterocapsa_arctica.AAC.1